MPRLPRIWRPARVEKILRDVCEKHTLVESDIVGQSRQPKHVHARWECWWLVRQELNIYGKPFSYPQIGLWFDREHTSVLTGVRKYEAWLKFEAALAAASERRRREAE